MTILFIPGMKNTTTSVKKIEIFLKSFYEQSKKTNIDIKIFDYKSKGVKSNFSRLFADEMGVTTDAVKRLKSIFSDESMKFTKIIAHSHGSLILYNAIKYLPNSVKEIHTLGGATFIPVMKNVKVINHYNKNDWVYQVHLKRLGIGSKLQKANDNLKSKQEIEFGWISKKKYAFQFYLPERNVESINIQSALHNEAKYKYKCTPNTNTKRLKPTNRLVDNNLKKHPHKLPCYKNILSNIL
jgi:hypothetical protein